MATLGNPENTTEIIQKYQFAFQKKFDQNFLIDIHVLDEIMGAAGITGDDHVLEMGPRIGTMAQHLAEHTGKVAAVETGTSLLFVLDETLKGYSNVTAINSSVLKLDTSQLISECNDGRLTKMAANLPYYITAPTIVGLPESNMPTDNITVMVQKEVTDQVQVGPNSKDYGVLSLAVQYYAESYIVVNAPPNCFIPRPNVGLAVIRLIRYRESPVQADEPGIIFRPIRTPSNQHGETLQNGLNSSLEVPYTKEQVVVTIKSLGVPASVREEALTLEQFAGSSNYLARTMGNGA